MTDDRPKITVAAVVEQQGRFLLVEERVAEGGPPVLNQPAGHVEAGESLVEAVCRETLEETGWHIEAVAVLGLSLYRAGNGLTYFRTAFVGRPLARLYETPPDTGIIATHWLTCDQMREKSATMRSPLVLAAVEQYRRGHRYPLDIIYYP